MENKEQRKREEGNGLILSPYLLFPPREFARITYISITCYYLAFNSHARLNFALAPTQFNHPNSADIIYVVRQTVINERGLQAPASGSWSIPPRPLWSVNTSRYVTISDLIHPNPPGECKDKMMLYMNCLRENSSTSTGCRSLSKDYLDCRMQK